MNITCPQFDDDEIRLLKQCLDSRWVTQGPFVAQFESMFSQLHEVEHALATTSCTAALHLAMLALGIGPGDEVIVPAFTWVTSAHSVEYVGARAVFADVQLETYNLDPSALENAITEKTKAVVVVHLFGLSAEMDEIMRVARKHNLSGIEEAACAVVTTFHGKPVGAFGDAGCFSFHPRKVITTGEGGMVTTNRKDIAIRVRSLRNHGATGPPLGVPDVNRPYVMGTFDMIGYNLRLSDIQAAVGVAQIRKLAALLNERQTLAASYHHLLKDFDRVILPTAHSNCGHTYQSYVIRLREENTQKRNKVMDYLYEHNIQTRPGTHAVHRLGYYSTKYNLKAEAFPNACRSEDLTITLPLFPNMTLSEQRHVCDTLVKAFGILS